MLKGILNFNPFFSILCPVFSVIFKILLDFYVVIMVSWILNKCNNLSLSGAATYNKYGAGEFDVKNRIRN